MTPQYKKLIISALSGALFLASTPFALAESLGVEYIPLAPIPGLTNPDTKTTNTATFLPGLFKLIIGLASVLAVVMLIYGGLQYMTTDAWGPKSAAKETIKSALIGLLLTLSAYLIVYTINPDALNFDLKMEKFPIRNKNLVVGETSGVGSPTSGGGGNCADCVNLSVPHKSASENGCSGTGFCQISRSLNSKLIGLHSRIPIYVTESYPPTRAHQNTCHAAGTCVDIRSVSDNRVYVLITAAQLSGLKAVFEVESEARKNTVIAASCNAPGAGQNCRALLGEFIAVLPGQITTEHFSIYNQ